MGRSVRKKRVFALISSRDYKEKEEEEEEEEEEELPLSSSSSSTSFLQTSEHQHY